MDVSRRIALVVEYVGSGFVGSQRQASGRTVEQELEDALTKIADHPVSTRFAGRTDSGVHATHQVVSFETTATRPLSAWVKGTNTHLGHDLAVVDAQEVDATFDARFRARWRRYCYVFGEATTQPAIGHDLVHWVPQRLNVEEMHEASQALQGEHDFSSFRAAGCQSNTPSRYVHKIQVVRSGKLVILDVIANAFLLRMVRNIAGALLELSVNCRGVDYLAKLLALLDREAAPPTAAAQGLYLVQVHYDSYERLSKLRVPLILGPTSLFDVSIDMSEFRYSRSRLK